MAHPIDHHVGQKLRQRRRLLGLTQQKLAEAVNIRFQQIQKYESGANRISASRLWTLSRALDVPVSYFFDGLNGLDHSASHNQPAAQNGMSPDGTRSDVFNQKETIDLVRAYYTLGDEPRRRLLDLAKAMSGAA